MTPLPNGLPIVDWMKYSDVQGTFLSLSFWQSVPEMKLPAESRRAVTVNDTSRAVSVTVIARGLLLTEGEETTLTAGSGG